MTYDEAVKLGEAATHSARLLADAFERVVNDNEAMKRAGDVMLPDGTPVEDVLTELKELKQHVVQLHNLLRSVKQTALSANSTTAYSALRGIRNLLNTKI